MALDFSETKYERVLLSGNGDHKLEDIRQQIASDVRRAMARPPPTKS